MITGIKVFLEPYGSSSALNKVCWIVTLWNCPWQIHTRLHLYTPAVIAYNWMVRSSSEWESAWTWTLIFSKRIGNVQTRCWWKQKRKQKEKLQTSYISACPHVWRRCTVLKDTLCSDVWQPVKAVVFLKAQQYLYKRFVLLLACIWRMM